MEWACLFFYLAFIFPSFGNNMLLFLSLCWCNYQSSQSSSKPGMFMQLELRQSDSFWDFESWVNWHYGDIIHWFLLPGPLELPLLLSSLKLGTLAPSCPSIKILFCKNLGRFGIVYNQRNLPVTSGQSFPFLCGSFFFTLWFTPRNPLLNCCGTKHSSWKLFNSHPRHLLILHCEVYSFSPKCLWANLNPMSSVATSFLIENNESVFSLTWYTCVAALSVL